MKHNDRAARIIDISCALSNLTIRTINRGMCSNSMKAVKSHGSSAPPMSGRMYDVGIVQGFVASRLKSWGQGLIPLVVPL